METVFSVLATPDLISEITKSAGPGNFEFDDPQPWESFADAADAPIGPQDIQTGLEIMTVALQTATALTAFVHALIDLKKKMDPHADVKVLDPKSGDTLLKLTHQTSDNEIQRSLTKK